MLRYLTAGESHDQALIATMEGVPAHVRVGEPEISAASARRRLGAGRGARMKFEENPMTLLGGFRHGGTLGPPIAIMVGNTEWPKWETVMASGEVDAERFAARTRNVPLTHSRPGYADLAGMQKYVFPEVQSILERASARETVTRVALGAVAAAFLDQALGVSIVSHVVELGGVRARRTDLPVVADLVAIDADPAHCFDAAAATAMAARVEECRKAGDTPGGVVEVVVWGLPPGLGSHIQGDRRLDSRLAGALMGIQAIKGAEFGDGFELARRRGSAAHDEILPSDKSITRVTRNAGGVGGGMSTDEVFRVRAAMRPIATAPRALRTVDVSTEEPAVAHHQRFDVCAVPVTGVMAEVVTALVLAELALEKFGGDSVAETHRNRDAYLADVAARDLGVRR